MHSRLLKKLGNRLPARAGRKCALVFTTISFFGSLPNAFRVNGFDL
jgi:hypothetical protein